MVKNTIIFVCNTLFVCQKQGCNVTVTTRIQTDNSHHATALLLTARLGSLITHPSNNIAFLFMIA